MGYTVTQIAEILGCNRQSIHNWFDLFEAQGYQGFYDKPRSGRPVTATVDYRTRLVEVIKTNPRKMGYPFTVWTLTRIRAHMAREMRILLSESRVRQIMKEEGLVFKRPKHTLAQKRDKDAFAEVRGILEQVKKNLLSAIIITLGRGRASYWQKILVITKICRNSLDQSVDDLKKL